MALSTVFHSINSPNNFLFSHAVLPVLSLSHRSFQLYISMKVSFSPDIIPSGWLGSKHQITNSLPVGNTLLCDCHQRVYFRQWCWRVLCHWDLPPCGRRWGEVQEASCLPPHTRPRRSPELHENWGGGGGIITFIVSNNLCPYATFTSEFASAHSSFELSQLTPAFEQTHLNIFCSYRPLPSKKTQLTDVIFGIPGMGYSPVG